MASGDQSRRRYAPVLTASWSAGLLLVLATALGKPVAGQTSTPNSASQTCWEDRALRTVPKEQVVRRGTFAYRQPPGDVAIPADRRIKRYYRRAIRRFKILDGEKVVSLTFDIGEQPHEISAYQGKIFDYLRQEKVRATVFLGGKWMVTHPVRTQQFIADPLFEVANHGWEHRNLRLLTPADQQRAILRAQSAYTNQWRALRKRDCRFAATGSQAHKNARPEMNLWRFPFGACNDRALKLVGDAGLQSIQWDVSSGDPWKGQTAGRMTRTVLGGVRSGSVVLFHANGRGWHTDAAVPQIVRALKTKGYRFVTVGDLLAMVDAGEAEAVLTKTCYDSRPGDTNRYDTFSTRLHANYARFINRARRVRKPKPIIPPEQNPQR